jgi:tetratricopeptide (TPR) repeat protein
MPRALALALLFVTSSAFARTTVGVVALTTTSSEEYQWIGPALASALNMRVALQPELNALTTRQINAAVRQDDFEGRTLAEPKTAQRLGKLLGADLLLVGSYEARWPSIKITLTPLGIAKGEARQSYVIEGDLDALVELEAQAARALASELGAKEPNISQGAFGTTSLKAWRLVTLAQATLDWQSLGPQAAEKSTALALPKAAVESAAAQLTSATQLDADYGEAWATLGVAQALLGNTREAWRSFGKATALGSGHHPTAVVGASFVRMREGRFEEAAGILRSGVDRNPGFLHARGYLGELYNHLGRHKEALAAFEEYAKLAPAQPWVLAQRGYTKSRLGDHTGAVSDTIAAVDLVPDSPALLIQLASRYIDAGKLIGAEDALMQAMKIRPDEARVYVRLGYVYLLQGKDELAIPVSEKALVQAKLGASNRDRAYAHLNLARAYGRQGDLDRAFSHLAKAKSEGLPSLAELDTDPKLAGMRKDPRYKKVD